MSVYKLAAEPLQDTEGYCLLASAITGGNQRDLGVVTHNELKNGYYSVKFSNAAGIFAEATKVLVTETDDGAYELVWMETTYRIEREYLHD